MHFGLESIHSTSAFGAGKPLRTEAASRTDRHHSQQRKPRHEAQAGIPTWQGKLAAHDARQYFYFQGKSYEYKFYRL